MREDLGNDEEALALPTRRFWRDRFKGLCIKQLQKDGWRVYTKGFPTVVAEKGNFMRLIVVSPRTNLGRGVFLGKGKDVLSKAFFKCFGVKYEIWENQAPETKEEEWV